MSIAPLTIIPAGAGSGKTYTIQTTLAQWIADGLVRPERIVAVTFTEAAAAELRTRIRQELSRQNRIEDALLLEQAYISTIHSFGLRLLREFAFDCGISPDQRLLNKDEENSLMRRALAVTDQGDIVMDNLRGFGYRYDFSSGKGAEELFRAAVLKLIAIMRSIGRQSSDAELLPHAQALITQLYGPVADAAQLEDKLHRAVTALLNRFPADMAATHADNATAVKALHNDYRALKQAKDKTRLGYDWALWQQLRNLRTIKMPPEYQAAAAEVVAAADFLPRHPGPLNDALVHVRALLLSGQDALAIHSEKKRQAGLLDYTDMLALSQQLFSSNSAVAAQFRDQIDCLIIDEFQDTNPLQFSLLWQFYTMGVPVLIVGDLKQAIMGFQNADARLLEALQRQYPAACRPLIANWRSTPQLLEWINAVGSGLFGADYTHLAARADYPSTIAPLEVLRFNKRPKKIDQQVQVTARHIYNLLNSSEQIYDRFSNQQRQLRGGDIAVLCPTNARLDLFAAALRNLGIDCRIARGGWFESRVVQLLYHALCYVADTTDRHAALYMSVTELGCLTLQEALEQMLEGDLPHIPVINTLQNIAAENGASGVNAILGQIIDRLSIYQQLDAWPDTAQARANLMRLQHEADLFHQTDAAALTSIGLFGSGIKTFLAWLQIKVQQEENNAQPDSGTDDENAVDLVTWHRAKGREWPVVVVAGMDKTVAARLPAFNVVYSDFDNLANILHQARIEISPDFTAPETRAAFSHRLLPEIYTSARRLQYVALTRARERLIIEWPQYQDKSKAKDKTHWALLREQTKMAVNNDACIIGAQSFPCLVHNADYSTSACCAPQHSTSLYRVAPAPFTPPQTLVSDSISPSQQHQQTAEPPAGLRTTTYAPPLLLALDLPADQYGTLLHRCFEVALVKDISGERLAALTNYLLKGEQSTAILNNIAAFKRCLQRMWVPSALTCELPLLFLNNTGSVVSGIIDLLVECENGFWIVDHKSDAGGNDATKFATYLPQLQCYAAAVAKARPDKPILGVAINWISSGSMTIAAD